MTTCPPIIATWTNRQARAELSEARIPVSEKILLRNRGQLEVIVDRNCKKNLVSMLISLSLMIRSMRNNWKGLLINIRPIRIRMRRLKIKGRMFFGKILGDLAQGVVKILRKLPLILIN